MATRPMCSLCGAAFRSPGVSVDLRGLGRHWNSQVRGIRGDKTSVDVAGPQLTGPGYISGGQIVASLDGRVGLLAENVADNRRDLSIFGDTTPIIYALHEFCWQTLLWHIGVHADTDSDAGADAADTSKIGPEAAAVAAWLFHLLAALPYSKAVGLITQDGYSGGLSVDGPEIRHADPRLGLYTYDINDITLADDEMAPSAINLFQSRWPADGESDPFSCLPLEIFHYLLDFVDSRDLCSARLASRFFAACTVPTSLPQRFWAGRFAPDKEMGWIDPDVVFASAPPSATADYQQLYRKCRQVLKTDDVPEGLHNRKRIWTVLGHFAVTLKALLLVEKRPTADKSPMPPTLPDCYSLGQSVVCPSLSSASSGPGSLVFGARIRHLERLDIIGEHPSSDPIHLRYSSIVFDGRTYISGLQVSRGADVGRHVGIMVPTAVRSIYLDPGTVIYEVDVYISIAGIHGIIIHAKTPDGRETAHLVGDTAPSVDSDIAVTRLEAKGSTEALLLGFDKFKLASLQLIDRFPTHERKPIPTPILWKSALPPKNAYQPTQARPSADPLTLSSFLTHLYIPFGGKEGSRLSSLIRVTALLDGAIGLHGLIFTYDDGEEMLYGARVSPRFAGPPRVCVEHAFLIDGPGGERIEQLIYSSRTGSDALRVGYPGISAMEILTNFNRQHTFRAFDNYGNVRSAMQQRTVQRSPDGQCPTVFTIGLGAPAWFFETAEMSDFVPVPQEADGVGAVEDSAESAPTDQALAFCPWMLSVGGSVFTTASLADLHRVRVSAGAQGRSRDGRHISGLWLEYRNRGYNAIVGQWMGELGEFTLQPREAIVDISVRLTKETELRGTGGVVGKVVCLSFVTSLGHKYEFRQSQAPAESHLHYSATPYEDLGTITWAFNSTTDDIQISLEPAESVGPGGQLLLCDADVNLRHPWLLQEGTRIFYKYSDLMPHIRHDITIHRRDAARRYTSQCDMLFWEERDPRGSGRMLRLLRLEVMGQDGIVDGFRFEYEEGLVRTFGAQDSDKHVMDFTKHKDERMSCLVVYYITDSRSSLEFHTTRGKVCRVFPDKEMSNQADSHAMMRGVRAPKLTLAPDHRKSNHHNFPDKNPSGNPVSECVGIWVAGPPRYQSTIPYVDSFGPVYRTNPGEQAS